MQILTLKMSKVVVSIVLLVALTLAALSGIGTPNSSSQGPAGITVVYADGCDGGNPPPNLDCPAPPTPTPTPHGN
jgi:hypothetical protein